MENILKIDKIEKYYGNKSSLTKAIDNLSFDVEKGEFVAIMGASGSGKTTLLNILSNYDKNYTGVISIDRKKMNKVDYLDMPVAYAMDQPSFLMS